MHSIEVRLKVGSFYVIHAIRAGIWRAIKAKKQ